MAENWFVTGSKTSPRGSATHLCEHQAFMRQTRLDGDMKRPLPILRQTDKIRTNGLRRARLARALTADDRGRSNRRIPRVRSSGETNHAREHRNSRIWGLRSPRDTSRCRFRRVSIPRSLVAYCDGDGMSCVGSTGPRAFSLLGAERDGRSEFATHRPADRPEPRADPASLPG